MQTTTSAYKINDHIWINTLGKITAGDDTGQFMKIIENKGGKGYFVHQSKSRKFDSPETYDAWAQNLEDLYLYFEQSKWQVLWIFDDSSSMDEEAILAKHYTLKSYLAKPLATTSFHNSTNLALPNNKFVIAGCNVTTFSNIYFNKSYGTCSTLTSHARAAKADWRMRSNHFNNIFFNPEKKYEPWIGYPEADFNCANIIEGQIPTGCSFSAEYKRDLAIDTTGVYDGFIFEVWQDDKGFSGSPNIESMNSIPNGLIDYWDTHYRYTVNNSNTIQVEKISYSKKNSPPSSCWLKPEIEVDTNPPFSNCFDVTVSNLSSFEDYPLKEKINVKDLRQNIANWFQYHRTRFAAAKTVTGNIFDTFHDKMYFGLNFINSSTINIEPRANQLKSDLLKKLYTANAKSGTPNRKALQRAGEYFKKTPNVLSACQTNASVLITDGHWTDTGVTIGDQDKDGIAHTLADVAHLYRHNDLRPDFKDIQYNLSNDGSLIQHQSMRTFTFTMGLDSGLVSGPDGFPAPSLAANDVWFGNPFNSVTGAVADTWHAAFNGDGFFESVYDVSKINALWQKLAKDIQQAVPTSLTSHLIIEDDKIFATQFHTNVWSGDVLRYEQENASDFIKIEKLAPSLKTQVQDSERNLWTYNSSDKSIVAMEKKNISSFIQTQIKNDNFTTLTDDEWLDCFVSFNQGNDSACPSTQIRKRSNILGDTITAQPVSLGPTKNSTGNFCGGVSEFDFSIETKDRTPYFVFATNDGMLHAMNKKGSVLKEAWAYIPEIVLPELSNIMPPEFEHKYLFNGGASIQNLCVKNNWKTVLIAGFGEGIKGVVALDVTYKKDLSKPKVLWEVQDRRIGNLLSNPQMGCISENKCYAFIQSGYNNDSVTQGLAMVDINTGNIDHFINVSSESLPTTINREKNGLSVPLLIDYDGNGYVESAYAGDLTGMLWHFNLLLPNKNATLIFKDSAKNPISVKPTAKRRTDKKGIVVLFGTGRAFTEKDYNSTTWPMNHIYGIYQDPNNPNEVYTSAFHRTEIISEDSVEGKYQLRIAKRTVDKADAAHGWYLPLISPAATANTGERVVANPQLISNFLLVNTELPQKFSNACEFSLTNWIMDLDAVTGLPRQSEIDFNQDSEVDDRESNISAAGYRSLSVEGGVYKSFTNPADGTIYTVNQRDDLKIVKTTRNLKRPYKIMNRIDIR
ncbi:MAG: PilC/PilY family type IV pilus protein [Pseudomonadota bacterium]